MSRNILSISLEKLKNVFVLSHKIIFSWRIHVYTYRSLNSGEKVSFNYCQKYEISIIFGCILKTVVDCWMYKLGNVRLAFFVFNYQKIVRFMESVYPTPSAFNFSLYLFVPCICVWININGLHSGHEQKFMQIFVWIISYFPQFFLFVQWGVESRTIRHCGQQWPSVPAPGDYDDEEIGGMIGRGNRSTRRKPAPVPLCPPQTPHAAHTRTRAAAVGSQRLTAWATARPSPDITITCMCRKILVNFPNITVHENLCQVSSCFVRIGKQWRDVEGVGALAGAGSGRSD
jgi:hypothetical protein